MAKLNELRTLLADARQNLNEAREEFERLRKRYGLAASVDAQAREKLKEAEKRLRALENQVEDLERQVAEAEAAENRRREEEARAKAQRKEEAEKVLPKAAREYTKALETLAAKIEEARQRIGPIMEEVLSAEVAAYQSYERVRALAHAAENVTGAEELLRALLRNTTWPAPLDSAQTEDLEHLAALLAGKIRWPEVFLGPLRSPPPRIRRAWRAEITRRLLERAKARAARRAA